MLRALILLMVLATSLVLPDPGLAKASGAKGRAQHTVRSGETLLGIAHAAGVQVAELKALNGLKGNLIRPGQVLFLPEKRPQPQASRSSKRKVAKTTPPSVALKKESFSYRPPEILPVAEGDLTDVALTFLSTPYRFGAEGREATDCSGFTQQVFRLLGLDLPRTAREQFRNGAIVPMGEWQYGDLLFFRTYARYPSHVAIYLGDGKMIHASRSQRKVVISDADRSYFRKRFLGARRVACFDPVGSIIERLNAPLHEVDEDGLFEADLAPFPHQTAEAVAPEVSLPPTSAPVAVEVMQVSSAMMVKPTDQVVGAGR
jgi:cell wall-associated NlpC family hydrolase